MRLLSVVVLLAVGRPLVYWGAAPPTIVVEGGVPGGGARLTEVHSLRRGEDLFLRFAFDGSVEQSLRLPDGTPVSGRLHVVLYFDVDDDRQTGLELGPGDPRAGADRRLELGVVYVGEDESEEREATSFVSVTLWSLRPDARRRTLWRADGQARPDCVSAYGDWIDVRLPSALVGLEERARLILTVGSRSWTAQLAS